MHWSDAVAQLRRIGEPGVLATVLEVRGHAPREAGAKLVLGGGRQWGTIGGGNLEAEAVARAQAMLAGGPDLVRFTNRLSDKVRTEHGRQCCGGEVSVLLERLPAPPTIAIAGLGHVGLELARILSRLDVRLELIDSRPDQLDQLRLAELCDGPAVVVAHHRMLPESIVERLPRGAELLIMTHDHAEDFALCDAALRFGPQLGRIGLIGSAAKWSRFARLLADAGHDEAARRRIVCPIGLTGAQQILGKEPALIAISVAAELAARGVLTTGVGAAGPAEPGPGDSRRADSSRAERTLAGAPARVER